MGKIEVSTLIDARVHSLYAGVTQSGKTTLARYHARRLLSAGYDVCVYDPVMTATAGGDWAPERAGNDAGQLTIFTDATKLIAWLEKTVGDPERPIFCFVDESADIFGHGNAETQYLPRRIRHQNIYLRLISQRPKMLPPNVRTQCAHTYLFRLATTDAQMLFADNGHDFSDFSGQLDSGDFLVLVSAEPAIVMGNVYSLVN